MYMEFSYLDFYSIISLIFFSTSFVKNFDQKKENIFFNDDYEHYPNTWDEMFKNDGKVRRSYKFLEKFLNNSSFDSIKEKQDFSDQFFMNQGITFTVYDNDQGVERIFPFDILPRIIRPNEWDTIEKGIVQRVKALNLFLKDIYNEQYILKDQIFPSRLLLTNPYFLTQMKGLKTPLDVYTHVSGVDLIRNNDGKFYVLEDNLRTPSGVCYMLENREVSRKLFPSIFPKQNVLSVSSYPQVLYNQLSSLVNKTKPTIVLLTPGSFNSAYYEHTTLARLMGVELVEGKDLVVDDNFVFMKTATGLQKVDVIYKRIDDEFLDPLVFNDQSYLGIAGIMNVYRSGNVVLANAPGAGIADDKASYVYVPEMIKYYLNEKPILDNITTYQLGKPDELDYVLKNINKMVIKKTDGSGGYGMLMGGNSTDEEIDNYIKQIKKNPANFIAQPTLNLSTTPCIIDETLSPRCVDLRPFAIFGGEGIKVCPGGLSRVALKKGSLVVNSSQGGGSKDTWVLEKNQNVK